MTSIADFSINPDLVARLTYQVNKYTDASARAAKSTEQTVKAIKSQSSEMAVLTGRITPAVTASSRQSVRTSYDPVVFPEPGQSASDFRFEADPSVVKGAKYSPPESESWFKDSEVLKGANTAFDDYRKKADDVAGLSKEVFSKTFDSMATGIATFAQTGKFSFSDFTHSVLADLAKIATEKAAVGLLGTLFDIGASVFSAPASQSFTVGGETTTFDPQLQLPPNFHFAKGAAFTNNIVTSPTTFGMAGGRTGLMGEAGPEAIIPLTRTSNGSLGVRAIGGFGGGAGGGSIQVNAPVSINTQDRSGDGMQLDQQLLQQNLQKQMTAAAERAVADSWRAGGISYRNANGRA